MALVAPTHMSDYFQQQKSNKRSHHELYQEFANFPGSAKRHRPEHVPTEETENEHKTPAENSSVLRSSKDDMIQTLQNENFKIKRQLSELKKPEVGLIQKTFGAITSFIGSAIRTRLSIHNRVGLPDVQSVEEFVRKSQAFSTFSHTSPRTGMFSWLKIRSVFKVESTEPESYFERSENKENNTLLFHGVPLSKALDDQDGFCFRSFGRMGNGIYFTADPWYCSYLTEYNTMVVCYVNLDGATGYSNSGKSYCGVKIDSEGPAESYDEYCVESSFRTIPLWVVSFESEPQQT